MFIIDKKLFTPGPLICSATIKQAMLRDLGSRDIEFIETVEYIRYTMLKKSAKKVQYFGISQFKKKIQRTSAKRSGLLRNEEKFPNIFDF